MQDMILLKLGEIVLKGLNKRHFEQKFIQNVRRRLKGMGEFNVYCLQSTVYVEPLGDCDMDEVLQAMTQVFGAASVMRAAACEKDIAAIARRAIEYLADDMRAAKSFKV
ncbi:MAG: tRNA 4-thiouridine(8) synthase ThiI, partial [Oscillospiraceae bacterium]|nr:tRNA 4-thiouridine(8) synthase ThiI [Oscillospiraceae bacterium]